MSRAFSKLEKISILIISLLLLCLLCGLFYFFGYQRNKATVELLKREQVVKDYQYGESIKTVQAENNQAATYAATICAEYQKLYSAYDSLYTKSGADAGQERYLPPGSAKGQVDPCYQ